MDIEVSIIIPSYNRYPLNLFNLLALENQTFNLSKMEVIFIDDASVDNTSLLKDYHPPFLFKYIQNQSNMGLSRTRNIGSKIAKGNIIFFLDAEIIVHPDFVSNHYRHHITKDQIVVLGRHNTKLYSYLFPEFSSSQINDIYELGKNRSLVEERLCERLKQNINDIELLAFIKKLKEPIQLTSKEDIMNWSSLESFSLSKTYTDKVFEQLAENFDDRHLSWMACFGSNLSIKKDLFHMVGGYDEDFRGWGHEDIEFSYRLYKNGTEFIVDPNLTPYHQEHPITVDKQLEGLKNMVLLQQKHPVIDVCIKSLELIGEYDFGFIDRVLRENKSLNDNFPGRFEDFKSSIVFLLQQIPNLKIQKKPVCNLLQSSGIGNDLKRKKRIFSERNEIEAYKNYMNLVKLFDLLTVTSSHTQS
ncbi:glycosyltransferase family 2 protein [Neobacillus sp. C211]|uniref:glycosyltransferase family 2 protein n=1 Tax=unclassified Neobacillus TaxID=2675272 RepID=UPI00397BD38A